MKYDDLIKRVLLSVDNGDFNETTTLPEISRDKLVNLLTDCGEQGFLSHKSSKQKLVTQFMDGGFLLHPSTFVTRNGYRFMENQTDSPTVGQQYNIHNVSGSNLGNSGTVTNNYSGATINDLKEAISLISDPQDKEVANELVETLENESLKPGLLKRFDNLLGKYPGIATTVGQFAVTVLTGML